MTCVLLLFAVVTLILLGVVDCFKFSVKRNISSGRELEKSLWIGVEVTTMNTTDDIDEDLVVKFEIPKALPLLFDNSGDYLRSTQRFCFLPNSVSGLATRYGYYNKCLDSVGIEMCVFPATLTKKADVSVFFANDAKEILQVNLSSTIQGKFYLTPHKLKKELKGNGTLSTEDEKFTQLSGKIPVTWLPKNYSKISAAVVGPDDQYYNYYKIQNFKISIPDLMVVEEYKNLSGK